MVIGLDFETYSPVDLKDHGAPRYFEHPDWCVTLAGTYTRVSASPVSKSYDFALDPEQAKVQLAHDIEGQVVVGHNVGFEKMVLRKLDMLDLPESFIDSAVIARAVGASSPLEKAAPQLLGPGSLKGVAGRELFKLFAIPNKYQEENGSSAFDPLVVQDNPAQWREYQDYCMLDAQLSWMLESQWGFAWRVEEHELAELTEKLNLRGWPVDMRLVEEMQRRFDQNKVDTLKKFHIRRHAFADADVVEPFNFNSPLQMRKFCEERGVKTKSFDETHVDKMIRLLLKKLDQSSLAPTQRIQYEQVLDMLQTKQVLGGSSLTKLKAITDRVSEDGRLRDTYLHAGAGQTLRTSGRGAQLQNLKRLSLPADMEKIYSASRGMWSNTAMASNLRQVFTASHKYGELFVGDLSSIESRQLAYMAGAQWKLDSFAEGYDLYKVQAGRMLGLSYDAVNTAGRQLGKVGELSCGYQAWAPAVKDFAEKMGTILTDQEAKTLVLDWREVNPEVVALWELLDSSLRELLASTTRSSWTFQMGPYQVQFSKLEAPHSLGVQHSGGVLNRVHTLHIAVSHEGQLWMRRYFQGVHLHGDEVRYYKASDNKGGDLWRATYRNPKTGKQQPFTLYGGKLTGIITQSLCRELFFKQMLALEKRLEALPNAEIIGQFHDEIVVDWHRTPGGVGKHGLMDIMQIAMTANHGLEGLPLAAEIKHAHRYIK